MWLISCDYFLISPPPRKSQNVVLQKLNSDLSHSRPIVLSSLAADRWRSRSPALVLCSSRAPGTFRVSSSTKGELKKKAALNKSAAKMLKKCLSTIQLSAQTLHEQQKLTVFHFASGAPASCDLSSSCPPLSAARRRPATSAKVDATVTLQSTAHQMCDAVGRRTLVFSVKVRLCDSCIPLVLPV